MQKTTSDFQNLWNTFWHALAILSMYVCHCIIRQSALRRQVRNLFQNEFSRECDLVFSLSISAIFSFPQGHPVAAQSSSSSSCHVYIFFYIFSVMNFRRQFLTISLVFFLIVHTGYSSPSWIYVTLLHFSHDLSNSSSPSHFRPFQVFLICFQKRPNLGTTKNCAPNVAFHKSLP